MFYDNENKNRDDVIYMDIRQNITIKYKHGNGTISEWEINPDIAGDFRNIPFEDESFNFVIFDPPHLTRTTGIIVEKYGTLGENWKSDIKKGFDECMRVLKTGGFLNFKWSDSEIPISEIKKIFPCAPIFSQRRLTRSSAGYWAIFRK